eukprot:CFRG6371T1
MPVQLTVDEVLKPMGVYSINQACIYLVSFLLVVPSAMRTMLAVYTHTAPTVNCELPLQDAIRKLQQEQHKTSDFSSIAVEWGLVCDRAWLLGLAGSVFFIGWFVGAGFFGWLSDNYGRRVSVWLGVLMVFSSTLGLSLVPQFWMYLVMNLCSGIGCGGVLMVSFVICVEWFSSDFRELVGVVVNVFFPIGSLLLVPIAYIIRSWRMLSATVALTCLLAAPFYGWLPESPHWLVAQGREDEALQEIDIAYKMSGITLGKDIVIIKEASCNPHNNTIHHNEDDTSVCLDESRCESEIESDVVERGTWTLLTHNIVAGRAWVVCLLWFTSSFVYYGLTMSSSTVGSNLYINMTLSSTMELIADSGTYPLLVFLGRKILVVGGMFLVSMCCFLVPIVDGTSALTVIFAVLGRSFIAGVFVIIYIYTAELFPTSLRGNAMGFSSQASRVGGTLAPYLGIVASSGPKGKAIAMSLFGVLSLLCGLSAMTLQETKGKIFDVNLAYMIRRLNKGENITDTERTVDGYEQLRIDNSDDECYEL